MELYDPYILNNGPWYIDADGQNYYNNKCNIEFMFEDELHLNEATNIDFVNHHSNYCNIYDDKTCPYLSFNLEDAKKNFVSYLIANDIKLQNLNLNTSQDNANVSLLDNIASVFKRILALLADDLFEGSNNISPQVKAQLCKSILDLIAKEKYKSAKVITLVFSSHEDLKNSLLGVFAIYFNIDVNALTSKVLDDTQN